jgi:hypothetical protein
MQSIKPFRGQAMLSYLPRVSWASAHINSSDSATARPRLVIGDAVDRCACDIARESKAWAQCELFRNGKKFYTEAAHSDGRESLAATLQNRLPSPAHL